MAKLKKGVERKLSKPKIEVKANPNIISNANLKTKFSSIPNINSTINNQKASTPHVSNFSYYATYGALFVLILFVFGYAGFSMFKQTAGRATSALIPETTINAQEPEQTSQMDASLQQPAEIKQNQEAQPQTPTGSEVKQETAQQLQTSAKKKPISKAIIISLVVILAAIGSMLAFIYQGKPGPLPAPPVIAKKEQAILAKREYGQLKEDDELFEV